MQMTRMLKPLPALALALFLAAGEVPEAQAQGAPECGCLAMRNVKNRLCETRAAQREYQRVAARFLADEKKEGKPILLDDNLKANIKTCVQEAVNQVWDRQAQDAKGETLSDCSVTVEAANSGLPNSKCIEAVVRRHEEHHRQECLTRNKDAWWKVWTEGASIKSALLDTKYAMSAVDYMAEEAAAYSMEEAELRETQRRLLDTCKQADRSVIVTDDDDVPGKKAGDKYNLDPSVERCPSRPRTSPSNCKY